MTDTADQIMGYLAKLDGVEAIIFVEGVRALSRKDLTMEQFQERVTGLVSRHRAGQPVTVDNLKAIGTP